MSDVRKEYGYKMADRQQGLNAAHMFMVVKELARIHALSWGYKQLNKSNDITEHFPFLRAEASDATMDMFMKIIESNIGMTIDAIKDEVCAGAIQGFERLRSNLKPVMMAFYSLSAAKDLASLLRVSPDEKFKDIIDLIDTKSKQVEKPTVFK